MMKGMTPFQPRARKRSKAKMVQSSRKIVPRIEASIGDVVGEMAPLHFVNRTSRPVLFWVTGVMPECGISVNGNAEYQTEMMISSDTSDVRILKGGKLGSIIAELHLEKQEQ